MIAPSTTNPCTRQRVPPESISHSASWSFRFCLSAREVDALMGERVVLLTDEAVHS